MEYGVWSMEYGVWSMEYGVWSMGLPLRASGAILGFVGRDKNYDDRRQEKM